jgi:hypothetical protein
VSARIRFSPLGEVRMAYTIWDEKNSRVLSPAVTINAGGIISLNAPLTRIFHKNTFKAVLLLFDAGKKRIALRPVTKKDTRSYSLSYGLNLSHVSTSGRSFLKEIGSDGKVHKIPANWDADKSVVEFNMPKWQVSGVRSGEKAG